MLEQPPKEETLHIIRHIEAEPSLTQRQLSDRIGISLGKTNYLIKNLIEKGFVEIKNFTTKPGKMSKIHYHLTKEGFEHKMQLMQIFLKKKEEEYYLMKQEWDYLAAKKAKGDL
ncbi:MAG: MarR family EPS-associated transcriptional regulator [Candidatus Omnitrophica bacterium]|nr:MarR family EPS-associated transcriptional regulator [Candidatus Omnitrophota bacterium]